MKKKVAKTPTGKTVETVDHGDGRKSCTIHVDTLNVPINDEGDKKAKEAIEGAVMDKLRAQKVRAIVLNKRDNVAISAEVPLPDVRRFALYAVEEYRKKHGKGKQRHFVIIQIDAKGVVSTSTL